MLNASSLSAMTSTHMLRLQHLSKNLHWLSGPLRVMKCCPCLLSIHFNACHCISCSAAGPQSIASLSGFIGNSLKTREVNANTRGNARGVIKPSNLQTTKIENPFSVSS